MLIIWASSGLSDYIPVKLEGDLAAARLAGFRLGFQEAYGSEAALSEAAKAASEADVAIVFTATGQDWESEGFDRDSIKLPRRQDDLIRAVRHAQPRTVVVNGSGAAVEMPWAEGVDSVPAILQA